MSIRQRLRNAERNAGVSYMNPIETLFGVVCPIDGLPRVAATFSGRMDREDNECFAAFERRALAASYPPRGVVQMADGQIDSSISALDEIIVALLVHQSEETSLLEAAACFLESASNSSVADIKRMLSHVQPGSPGGEILRAIDTQLKSALLKGVTP